MVPLAAGLSIDFFVIAHLILETRALAAPLAIAVFAVMMFCWFVFPRIHDRRRWATV